jgi:hypothetical protein
VETVTLRAEKDNTLYEDQSGSVSNGAGDHFFVGRTGRGLVRRGVIAFIIADSIPTGATIDEVTLTLHLSKVPPGGSGPVTVALHELRADWGEGSSHAQGEEGQGAPSSSGDATWIHSAFDTQLWSSAGGDFSNAPSSSQNIAGEGFYAWSGTQIVGDVQSWLDNPSSEFGWILIGNESTDFTARRFDSRENSVPAFRPQLRVRFTPAP